MWQIPFTRLMMLITTLAVVTIGMLFASVSGGISSMRLSPQGTVVALGEPFEVTLEVGSHIPVNVFKGLVRFDPEKLTIEKIDYNTSIADLWAEEPWYENGAGTLSFIGGTTKPGGFTGEGILIRIYFKSINSGETHLKLEDVRILAHDGLGTETELEKPIDALFTVEEAQLEAQTVETPAPEERAVTVLAKNKSTDLNNDGLHSLVDISIFMRDLSFQNLRSDFNGDGIVSTKDLSIILNPNSP